jgi:lactoylglutathione lyase
VAKYLEEVRGRGAPIDVELKTGFSRCIQFWTHDPDGNRIEFMELPPDCLQVAANKRIAAEDAAR